MLDRDPSTACPETRSIKDRAAARLREAIVHGELPPGTVVSEAGLAERFGLGKAAIRDALARLSTTSLVVAGGRRGWQVAGISGHEIGEIIALRRRLEPALAGVRLPDTTLDALAGLAGLGELGEAVRQDRRALASLRRYDRDFLHALVAAAAGATLARWLGELWDRSDQIHAFLAPVADRPLGCVDRAPLVAALRAGDEDAAERELRRPVERFEAWAGAALLRLPAPLHGAPADAPLPRRTGLDAATRSTSDFPASPSSPNAGDSR